MERDAEFLGSGWDQAPRRDRQMESVNRSDSVVEHKLKTWPVYFDAIERGDKTFEVRRDDRGFQKGDILILQRTQDEFPHHRVVYDYGGKVANELRRRIKYVLTGGQFGIEPGYVVMQLEEIEAETPTV